MKLKPCCQREFVKDRDVGEVESVELTIGRCAHCRQTLVLTWTPYGPKEGSIHPITAEKHGQLVEGSEADLEIFREKWLKN